jgi:hypothetical protein
MEPRPIACTLTAADLQSRSEAWRRLLLSGEVVRLRVSGGIQLRPSPAAASSLLELIDLERECCSWIDFEVSRDSTVTLTAEGDGEAVLTGMFLIPE